jgi:predicted SAM-dependent methyltransferase
MTTAVNRFLYKWAWDRRCRAVDTMRVLRQVAAADSTILDAGCGEYGLTAFMPGANITGVDVLPEDGIASDVNYVRGSLTDLPFDDRSFDVVVAIDVLEHLSPERRSPAVGEAVRIARRAVIITFPSGRQARAVDEQFATELDRRGKARPDWLDEHLANPYPETKAILDEIRAAANNGGRAVETAIHYSEPLQGARLVRLAAERSPYLFLAGSLAAGFVVPLMTRVAAEDAYRTIAVATFDTAVS